jgi:hypothetical protein
MTQGGARRSPYMGFLLVAGLGCFLEIWQAVSRLFRGIWGPLLPVL